MVVARRSYAGGAKPAVLTAPISAISTTLVCDALLGWPTGGLGNFAAVIDRGQSNEEKVLCSATSGGNLTVIQRGYDGTTAQAHGAAATVEHIFTATDADEANAHTSSVSGHGIPNGDRLVGENATQTLTGKTMSGALNTFDDLPLASSPETLDRIVAIELVDTDQQAEIDALPTVAEVNALIAPGVAESAAQDANRYTKAEADARYEPIDSAWTKAESDARFEPLDSAYTKAEVDALIVALAPADTGWVTATTGFTAAAGWTLDAVRYRKITYPAFAWVDLYIAFTRTGSTITTNASGNISNVDILSAIPVSLRPTAQSVSLAGPGKDTGRLLAVAVNTDGTAALQAITPENFAAETGNARGTYLL